MCMERSSFSQTMASEWQTAFYLSQNVVVYLAHCRQELQQKYWKNARLFLQDRDQDQDQDLMIQHQDQDFHFCLRGASRPWPWSRGLYHWVKLIFRRSYKLSWTEIVEKNHRPIKRLAARSGCESPLETVEVDLTDPDPIFYDRSMPLVYLASEGWRQVQSRSFTSQRQRRKTHKTPWWCTASVYAEVMHCSEVLR